MPILDQSADLERSADIQKVVRDFEHHGLQMRLLGSLVIALASLAGDGTEPLALSEHFHIRLFMDKSGDIMKGLAGFSRKPLGSWVGQVQWKDELGEFFDRPVKTYSTGMRARLQFGLSLAFDFDMYISDEVTATGDAGFREKALAAFRLLADHAGLIRVSHAEGTLKLLQGRRSSCSRATPTGSTTSATLSRNTIRA